MASHLDLDAVADALRAEPGIGGVALYDTLCTPQGQAFLVEDLRAAGAERFCIVGCSAREHEATFRSACRAAGLNPYLFAMANVREQCAWVTADKDAATAKAIRLARAAAWRAARQEPLAECEVEACSDVLIVGSGVAGLTAARLLADAGRHVVLVERDPCAGGRMAVLADLFPALECASCMLDPLVDEVLHHPNVELMTLSEVESLPGRLGAFTARIRTRPRRVDAAGCYGCAACHEACPVQTPSQFDRGTVHKAIYIPYTGAVPHVSCVDPDACLYVKDGSCHACAEACPFGNLRLDELERVEERRVGAVIVATGDEPQSLAPGLPSRVVSAVAFERLVNEAGPTGGEIRLDGGDPPRSIAFLRCAGADGAGPAACCSGLCCSLFDKYAALARKRLPQVRLVDLCFEARRSPSDALRTGAHVERLCLGPTGRFRVVPAEGAVRVEYQGASGAGALEVDLAVVAPPLVGSLGTRRLAESLGLDLDADGFLLPEHLRLRPFAGRADGVFFAGSAQGPKDVPGAATQGAAAAAAVLSALQPGRRLRIDPLRAEVDAQRCSGCGVCAAVCPYQAIGPGPEKASVVDPDRCRGCGACAAACPAGAIAMPGFTDEQIEAEIAALLC